MTLPRIRPKVVAENERSENPLSISSTAIRSPPNPKPNINPNNGPPWPTYSGRTSLIEMPAAEHNSKKKIRMNQNDMLLGYGLRPSVFWTDCGLGLYHMKCQKPIALRLLVVMVRFRTRLAMSS